MDGDLPRGEPRKGPEFSAYCSKGGFFFFFLPFVDYFSFCLHVSFVGYIGGWCDELAISCGGEVPLRDVECS